MNVHFINGSDGRIRRPVSEFAQAAYAEAIQAELASVASAARAQAPGIFGANAMANAMNGMPGSAVAEEEWNDSKGAPPISRRALGDLPTIKVTEEELVQDGNDFCCVCLEPHKVGDMALQLPCGHLYHPSCGMEWLQKHCTCPNCRYELESVSSSFERGRAQRMRERRPRFRIRDLERRPVRELRSLLRDHGISQRGACEKRDLVDRLVLSGSVQIIPEPRVEIACDQDALNTLWTTKELKGLMLQAGVDSSVCVEKEELVEAIVTSGRVVFAHVNSNEERLAASTAALAALHLEERRRRADLLLDEDM